jgi:2',3'-cyclic-nucleotide 2'-phosphodiesterase (5'-nucleotidase family)
VFRDSFTPGSVAGWVGAQFPYLSANLEFSADADLNPRFTNTTTTAGLEEAASQKGRIVPSAVVTKNGEKIGLVGATTQVLEQISSTGGVEVKGFTGDGSERDDMALLASQLQPVIDDLISQGVNKVILMAHLQQIANEKALAPLLRGVDIILAGGSNTRLGDSNDQAVAFPGHGANFADAYPLVTQGADGAPTLIVNTDNEYTYLGRLVVDFDAQGRIIPGSVDPLVSGAYAATAANVAKAWNVSEAQLSTTAFADGTKAENVQDLTDAVQAVIASKDGQVWGFTKVYLEGERAFVRSEETNLGDLTADANLEYARKIDPTVVLSLKNGGGIRSQIGAIDVVSGAKLPPIANPAANKPAGGVSTLDIENSLRFNNSLSLVTVSASKLKELLEHGIAVYPNQGRFPQVSGLAFSFDLTKPAGSRILNLTIEDSQGRDLDVVVRGGSLVGNPARTFRMVTLNFLAGGGDSYPFPTDAAANRVDLYSSTAPLTGAATFSGDGTEQDALAEYLKSRHATPQAAYSQGDVPPAGDLRLQNLASRGDTVLDRQGAFVTGAGAGGQSQFKLMDASGNTMRQARAFGTFNGPVSVAYGYLNNDGIKDIVVAAGPGGGPHVKVFDGLSGNEIASFFAYDANFRGGVNVAVGDLNGDGRLELITGAGAGGGPHVKAFALNFSAGRATTQEVASFFAYAPSFRGGVSVAAGDVNGDGASDIITGAGPGGGPHVKAFGFGAPAPALGARQELASFYAYDANFRGGVSVASGNINGLGPDEIITGAGAGGGPHVKAFSRSTEGTLSTVSSFFAYDPSFRGGVEVGSMISSSNLAVSTVLTGAGPGGGPHVRGFDLSNPLGQPNEVLSFYAESPAFRGGVAVS